MSKISFWDVVKAILEVAFFAFAIFALVNAGTSRKTKQLYPPYRYYYWNVEGGNVIIHTTKECKHAKSAHRNEIYKYFGFDDMPTYYCPDCCTQEFLDAMQSISKLNNSNRGIRQIQHTE